MLRRAPGMEPERTSRRIGRRPGPHLRATYVLAGPLRWVEPDGSRAVLRVDAANPAGRRFCGHSVTVELADVRVTVLDPNRDDLCPGQLVTVRARLPKQIGELPTVLRPRTLVALGPLQARAAVGSGGPAGHVSHVTNVARARA